MSASPIRQTRSKDSPSPHHAVILGLATPATRTNDTLDSVALGTNLSVIMPRDRNVYPSTFPEEILRRPGREEQLGDNITTTVHSIPGSISAPPAWASLHVRRQCMRSADWLSFGGNGGWSLQLLSRGSLFHRIFQATETLSQHHQPNTTSSPQTSSLPSYRSRLVAHRIASDAMMVKADKNAPPVVPSSVA